VSNLGLIALTLLLASAGRWFWRAYRVNIPKNPILFISTWLACLGMGSVAYYLEPADPYAGSAIGIGLVLLYLVSTGAQKVGDEMINVRDQLPQFTAIDEHGNTFDSSTLSGKRVLLKFFRGHW